MSENKKRKADKKKKLKKAFTKTARIIFGIIGAIIAILAIIFIVYAIIWLKDGENTTAAIVFLIFGAAGVFIDFKIAVKIKDSIFEERMKQKFGDNHNAPAASLTPESAKNKSESEKAYDICAAYRGESGGRGDTEYRITGVDFSTKGSSVKFSVEVEIITSWQPGANEADYQRVGRSYANEIESKLKREITAKANSIGLYGVSVYVKSTVR